jgi:signal transduction histidine kinase/DNA-binding response OmpR family regulator
MARVLIVDDEKSIRNTVSEFLRLDGHEVQAAENADAADALMQAHSFDVVVTDIILPRVSGVTLLQRIKERAPDIQVIMMTGEPTVDTAVDAVRAGAYDYLSKPTGKRELLAVVGQAARVKALLDEQHRLKADNQRYQENLERMVGERTEALVARTRQLEAVREVVAEISGEMNLHHVLSLIASRAMDLVAGLSATVFLWDEEAQCLVPKAWPGYGEWRGSMRLRLGEGVAGSVADRREGLVLEDYQASPYALPSVVDQTHVGPTLAEPLLYRHQVVGVIVVDRVRGGRCFSIKDKDVLALFANHAAIAIENARLYEASQRHAAELETRVRERTVELDTARRAADAASLHKSAFLATMSHELRTPLNSILGFAQLLQEQTKEALSTKQTRFLTNIYTSGQHLLQLINDILDLSKVEAGKIVLNLQSLSVATTLEDLLVIARGLANQKGQTLQVEVAPGLPALTADPIRFKQIFFNLASNAVKFTPDGGRITVRACTVPAGEQRSRGAGEPGAPQPPSPSAPLQFLELAVADTGVGIRPEDLPRLFKEFTQLETTAAQAHEGTGLGLALTKRLVELHGGTITAASDGEGQGSTFTVRLPFGGPTGGAEK